jgi:hypothetical protein
MKTLDVAPRGAYSGTMTNTTRYPRSRKPGPKGHAAQPACMRKLIARYPHATAAR